MCLRWLSLDEYSSSKLYPDGRTPYCSTCTAAAYYGLTQEQLTALYERSAGKCGLCGGTNENGRRLSVDHDSSCCSGARSCGRCVRSLLCSACNSGLGYFADSVAVLRAAAEYVEAWTATGLRDVPEEPPQGGKGRRWAKFRLSAAAYDDLLTSQDGRCAVCRSLPGARALSVDHDHTCCPDKRSCGRCVRGLLCGRCNSGIGMFKDSPELLRTAIAYVERYAN
ncbi:endonuclease domain-containing protein [Streptomyces sp. NPDC002561]|uniref:endonuclease domain-containing protein n=1 Tax=Streptomyces sp. NPDC002561 TaxID=3154418 RepID=UPI00332CD47A